MANVPFWKDIESNENYINAPVEDKLTILDGWEKDRYAEGVFTSPESKMHFEAAVFGVREKLSNPEGTDEEILQGITRRKQFQTFDYRNRFEETRKRDARINAQSLGRSTYLNEDIVFSDAENNWIKNNNVNQNLSNDWVIRKGLNEDDPEDYEVNYALALLGKDEFSNRINAQDNLSQSDKNRIISNYKNYEIGAYEDLFTSISSKQVGTTGNTFQEDEDDDEILVESNPMFLTKDRLNNYRKKASTEPDDMEAVVDNIVLAWGDRRGLNKEELLNRDNPLRENIKNFYKDSLLEHREVWQDGEVARQNSAGEWVLNKKWTGDLSLTEEQVREKVEKSSLDIPKEVLESFLIEKGVKDDVVAQNLIDQVYMTFEGEPSWFTPAFAKELYTFIEANKDKDWTAKDIVREYQKEFKGVGFFGKSIDFVQSAMTGAAYIFGDAAAGGIGMARNLMGDKEGEELLAARRQFQQSKDAMDKLSGNKWGSMLGGEAALILATLGGSSTFRAGSALFDQSRIVRLGNNTKKLKAVNKRLDGIANNLENGDILNDIGKLKRFTNRVAGETYAGLQASRSMTGFYSDSYFTRKENLMSEGMDEDEAGDLASRTSIGPSLLAGAVTWGLMKLIPGGAEDAFTNFSTLTTKQLAAKMNMSPKKLGELLKNDKFKDAAKGFLREQGRLKTLTSSGAGGFIVGGVKESVEEGLDEFFQGVNAMVTYNQELTMDDVLSGAFEGAIVGGILGASISGPISLRNRNISQFDPEIQARVQRLNDLAVQLETTNPETAQALNEKQEELINNAESTLEPVSEEEIASEVEELQEAQASVFNESLNKAQEIIAGDGTNTEKAEALNSLAAEIYPTFQDNVGLFKTFRDRVSASSGGDIRNAGLFPDADTLALQALTESLNQDGVTPQGTPTKRFIIPKARSILSAADDSNDQVDTNLLGALDAALSLPEAEMFLNRRAGVKSNKDGAITKRLNGFLNTFNSVLDSFNNAVEASRLDPQNAEKLDAITRAANQFREAIKSFYKTSRQSYNRTLKKTYKEVPSRNTIITSAQEGEAVPIANILNYVDTKNKFLDLPTFEKLNVTSAIPGDAFTSLSAEDNIFINEIENLEGFSEVDRSNEQQLEEFIERAANELEVTDPSVKAYAFNRLVERVSTRPTTPTETPVEPTDEDLTTDSFRNWVINTKGKNINEVTDMDQAIALWNEFSSEVAQDLDPNQAGRDIKNVFGTFGVDQTPAQEDMGEESTVEDPEPTEETQPPSVEQDIETLNTLLDINVDSAKEIKDLLDEALEIRQPGDLQALKDTVNYIAEKTAEIGIDDIEQDLGSVTNKNDLLGLEDATTLKKEIDSDLVTIGKYYNTLTNRKLNVPELLGITTDEQFANLEDKYMVSLQDATTIGKENGAKIHAEFMSGQGVYLTPSSFNYATGEKAEKSRKQFGANERIWALENNKALREKYPIIEEVPEGTVVKKISIQGLRDRYSGKNVSYKELLDADISAVNLDKNSLLYKYFLVLDGNGEFVFTNNPYTVAAWFSYSPKKGERSGPIEIPKGFDIDQLNPAFIRDKNNTGNKIIGVRVNFPSLSKPRELAVVEAGGTSLADLHSENAKNDGGSKKKGTTQPFNKELDKLIEAFGALPNPDQKITLTPEEYKWLGLPEDPRQSILTALETAWNRHTERVKLEGKERVEEHGKRKFMVRALLSILKTRIAKKAGGNIGDVKNLKALWNRFQYNFDNYSYTEAFKNLIDKYPSESSILGDLGIVGLFSTEKTVKQELKYIGKYQTEGLEGNWGNVEELISRTVSKEGTGTRAKRHTTPINEASMSMVSKAFEDVSNTPFDGLTDKTRRKIKASVRKEIEELGLVDGDPESLRVALNRIVIGAQEGKYLENYGNVAKMLLDSGLDLSNINFKIGIEAKVAGYYKPNKTGSGGEIAISNNIDNGRGVHDLVTHEILHSVLDNIISNPSPEQEIAILAIDTLIDKGRIYFEDFVANRRGGARRAFWQAAAESADFDIEVIKRLVDESNSPIKEELNLDNDTPSDLDYRNIYRNIRVEELKGAAYYDDVSQLRHAFGVNPDGTFRDTVSTRKEFIAHFLTDPTVTWFLSETDRLSSSGTLLDKLIRGVNRAITLSPPDERESFLRIFLSKTDGSENYIDLATIKNIRDITGLSEQDIEDARNYRESVAAFTGEPISYSESQEVIDYWDSLNTNSPARTVAAAFNVSIVPSDNVGTPEVYDSNVVMVPKGYYPEVERDILSKVVETAYTQSYATGRRTQVAGGFVQSSPDSADTISNMMETAGSFEGLMGDLVADAYYGKESSEELGYGYPLSSLRNHILAGNFGQRVASQLDQIMGAMDNIIPNARKYADDAFINGNNSFHRVTAATAIRKFNLNVSPDSYIDLFKTAVETRTSFEDLLDENFIVEEDRNDLEKIKEYHIEQLNKYSESSDPDTVAAAALEKDLLGLTSNTSFSEAQTAFEPDEDQKRRGSIFSRLFKIPQDPKNKFEKGDPLPLAADYLGVVSAGATLDTKGKETLVRKFLGRNNLVIKNLDRFLQGMSVSGRAGAVFQKQSQELRNNLSKRTVQARNFDLSIRSLIAKGTGDKEFKQLDKLASGYKDVFLERTWGVDSAGEQLAQDINTTLGTTDDDAIVDEFIRETDYTNDPNYALNLRDERNKKIKIASGIKARKSLQADKIEKEDGNPDRADKIRSEARAEMNKQVDEANDAYHSLWVDLYKAAADHFREKQEVAFRRVKQFDEYINQDKELTKDNSLYVNLRQLRGVVTDLQKDITKDSLLADVLGNNLPRNLRAKLGASEDVYLTKTYQALDNSRGYGDWIQSVDEEAQERYRIGFDYFADQIAEEQTDKLKPEENNLSRVFVKNALRKQVDSQEVKLRLQNFLESFQRSPRGTTLGLSNPKVLAPRKPIDAPLRKFVGEYEDNIYNASRTLTTLSALVENNRFLNNIKTSLESAQAKAREDGNRDVVFITDKAAVAQNNGLVKFHIADRKGLVSREQLGPLADLYAPSYIVEGIQGLGRKDPGEVLTLAMRTASWTMANLTSRRPRTHVRNFLGNPMFLVASGMPLNAIGHIFRPLLSTVRADKTPFVGRFLGRSAGGQAFRDALAHSMGVNDDSMIRKLLGTSEGPLSVRSEEVTKLRDRWAELGVTNQDLISNIRQELAEAMGVENIDPVLGLSSPGKGVGELGKKWRQIDGVLNQLYAAEDEYWKITAFEGQLNKLASVFGLSNKPVNTEIIYGPLVLREKLSQMTEEQANNILGTYKANTPTEVELRKIDPKAAAIDALEKAAAENVRLTMPNYSNTIDYIRRLKKLNLNALVAPFISFQAEMLRIMFQTPTMVVDELKLANDLRARGLTNEASKMASMAFNRGAWYGISTAAGAKGVSLLATTIFTVFEGIKQFMSEDDEEFNFDAVLKERLAMAVNGQLEKDTQRFLTSWYRRGHIAVLDIDREKGKTTWSDISHLVPQSDVTAPIANLLASFQGTVDESVRRNLFEGMVETIGPYFAKQIWLQAILGTDSRDSTLQEINQNFIPIGLSDRILTTAKTAIPGFATDAYSLLKAMTKGETTVRGRVITPFQEFMSAGLGQKVITSDMKDRLNRRLKFTAAGLRDAKTGFRDVIRGGTTTTPDEVEAETLKWQQNRQEFIRRAYKDILAAKRTHLTEEDVEMVLEESSLSSSDKDMIFNGYYTPSYLTGTDYKDGEAQDEEFGTSSIPAAEKILNDYKEITFDEQED